MDGEIGDIGGEDEKGVRRSECSDSSHVDWVLMEAREGLLRLDVEVGWTGEVSHLSVGGVGGVFPWMRLYWVTRRRRERGWKEGPRKPQESAVWPRRPQHAQEGVARLSTDCRIIGVDEREGGSETDKEEDGDGEERGISIGAPQVMRWW